MLTLSASVAKWYYLNTGIPVITCMLIIFPLLKQESQPVLRQRELRWSKFYPKMLGMPIYIRYLGQFLCYCIFFIYLQPKVLSNKYIRTLL